MFSSFAVTTKRVYEVVDDSDGYRVLVDRLWPRGITKVDAHLDEWCKDVAPSSELRRWFSHDPAKFDEFSERYLHELMQTDASNKLLERARKSECQHLTLVYAARDPKVNHAAILQAYLRNLVCGK